MREATVLGPVPETSYFSYQLLRIRSTTAEGLVREPDNWVIEFYRDLGRNLETLAGVPADTRVGVLDREFSVGDDW